MVNQDKILRVITGITLCSMFLLFSMSIVLAGSGVYQKTVERSDENYTHRIALSYIVNQARRSDKDKGIAVGTFADNDALLLREYYDESTYYTILYFWEGSLRELFVDAESINDFSPDDGMEILELSGLELEINDGIINVTAVTTSGQSHTTDIYPRSGLEEVGEIWTIN